MLFLAFHSPEAYLAVCGLEIWLRAQHCGCSCALIEIVESKCCKLEPPITSPIA